MASIGTRIKELRAKNNIKQDDLAKQLNISTSMLGMIEQGRRNISDEAKLKLCQIFNCSMDYIMGLTDILNPKKELESQLRKLNLSSKEYDTILNKWIVKQEIEIPSNVDTKIEKANAIIFKFYINYNKNQYIPINKIEDIDTIPIEVLQEHFNNVSDTFVNLLKTLDKDKIVIEKDSNISENMYPIPLYGQISAGEPNWVEEDLEGYFPIAPELMGIINPKEYFFLRVNGESMNKLMKNGSLALIHKQDYIENGEIAVVLVNGDNATIKKFTRQDNIIVLEPESNDPEFKTQVYDKKTPIRILGKYVGKLEMNV